MKLTNKVHLRDHRATYADRSNHNVFIQGPDGNLVQGLARSVFATKTSSYVSVLLAADLRIQTVEANQLSATLETLLKKTNPLTMEPKEPVSPVLCSSSNDIQRQASCEIPQLSTENEQDALNLDSQGDNFSEETALSNVAGSESHGTMNLPTLDELTVNHL